LFLVRWIIRRRAQRQAAPSSAAGTRLAPGQWTLAGMMSLTTIVAISLALARRVDFPHQQLVAVIITCVGFSVTSLFSLAVAHHMKTRCWRIASVLLLCPLAGAVVGLLIGPIGGMGVMAAVALVQSLTIVFFVEVLTLRFDTRKRPAHQALSAS